ncbi:hypothetical protein Naga_100030g3 [Nannochloropsis gaditana]|uniref:Uncharacterized protein n=1 Tax=Nannochloropsis gaditana TaxID=72520 RepID=W7TJG5_9STRA|nr:hypothetical protein Naga_100030g3 [Nannochloropsis gaditana]
MPPATNQVSSPRRSREPLWSFIAAHAILCINPARAFLTPTSAIGSLPCSTSSPSPFVSQARPFPAGKLWSQCPPTSRTSPTNNAIEIRQPLLLPAAAHSRDSFLRFLPRPPPSLSPPPSPASHHIRRMSLSDLSAVVLLAAREFTPLNELAEYGGTPSGGLVEEFEAWGLRQKVRWGMLARYLYPDDHEVLLLVEGEEGVYRGKRGKEAREGGGEGGAAGLLGMVELSLQPTTGLPPPPLPPLPSRQGPLRPAGLASAALHLQFARGRDSPAPGPRGAFAGRGRSRGPGPGPLLGLPARRQRLPPGRASLRTSGLPRRGQGEGVGG